MRWYRNVVSHGLAVQSVALLPISVMKLWAWSDKGPRVSTTTGKNMWLAERVLYLVVFLTDAAAAALPASSAFCDM